MVCGGYVGGGALEGSRGWVGFSYESDARRR